MGKRSQAVCFHRGDQEEEEIFRPTLFLQCPPALLLHPPSTQARSVRSRNRGGESAWGASRRRPPPIDAGGGSLPRETASTRVRNLFRAAAAGVVTVETPHPPDSWWRPATRHVVYLAVSTSQTTASTATSDGEVGGPIDPRWAPAEAVGRNRERGRRGLDPLTGPGGSQRAAPA